MAKGKKTNPRRIPATQADVEKARVQGAEAGLVIAVWAAIKRLQENEVSDEGIRQYASDVMDVCESLNQDYINYSDIRKTLEDEYQIVVRLT